MRKNTCLIFVLEQLSSKELLLFTNFYIFLYLFPDFFDLLKDIIMENTNDV